MSENDFFVTKEFDYCTNYDSVETILYNRRLATSCYLAIFYDNKIILEQCWYSIEYDRVEFLNDWNEGQEYYIIGVLSIYLGVEK